MVKTLTHTIVTLPIKAVKSPCANIIPTITTGGIKATDMATPAKASMILGQKNAKVSPKPEKSAIKK